MFKSNKRKGKIYLDYAASALPNPSSIHELGIFAKKKLQNARAEVARVLGARGEEIIFTSGGTESNNLAIQGVILAWHEKNSKKILPHIITTNIEHPSVLETCRLLQKRNLAKVSIVKVESNGIVDPKKIKKEIKNNTALVSIMYANNEIGTIQPIKEIAKEIRYYKKTKNRNNIFFHTDAVQAVNYLDLNVEKLGVDFLTLSGSKIKDAGRVGVLFKRMSVPISSIFGGGDQEMGFRPGTENLAEIVKFSKAFMVAQKNKEKEAKKLIQLRDYFFRTLFRTSNVRNSDVQRPKQATLLINGDLENRLPNNINITFPKIPSDLLVIELSARGIMASSKSACESSKAEGSYVIKAIHPEINSSIGGLRFSLGQDTKKEQIDYTIKTLIQILTKLKKWYN